MSDAVFVFGRDGRIAMVNASACVMLRYDRADILGRSAGMLFAQQSTCPDPRALSIRRVLTECAMPRFDTALRTASGGSVPVSFSTSFLTDEGGRVIGILGVARDTREAHHAAQQLRRRNETLEEEVRALLGGIREGSPARCAAVAPREGDVPSLRDVERAHIRSTLAACDGNRTRAARLLGISRVTLLKKIREYGL
jgi:PAS domain S-box-containing protein